jgi:LPXTG-motif cell wall-anchored protein
LVLTAANPPPPNVDASAAKGEDSADAGATGADSGANAGGSDTASAAVKPQAPKTGDAGIIALSVVMIIAAAGIVILRRKAVK